MLTQHPPKKRRNNVCDHQPKEHPTATNEKQNNKSCNNKDNNKNKFPTQFRVLTQINVI